MFQKKKSVLSSKIPKRKSGVFSSVPEGNVALSGADPLEVSTQVLQLWGDLSSPKFCFQMMLPFRFAAAFDSLHLNLALVQISELKNSRGENTEQDLNWLNNREPKSQPFFSV